MKFKMTPNKLMIAIFAVILLVLPITTIILPKADKSENENRTLAKMPTLIDKNKWEKAEAPKDYIDAVKWRYLTNREGNAYKDDFENYLCDHLAGRETWVKACNRLQALSGKREINGVYTLKNQLIQSFKSYDPEDVDKSIKIINQFAERHPDMQTYIMIAPTAQEFFGNQIPNYAGLAGEKAFIDDVYKKMENVGTIDCLSYLSGHADEYIYYRTDHHWTSLGAFYAYNAAAKSMGYSAYGLGSFNIETASNSFYGTLYSKTLDDRITADVMEYYHLVGGDPKVKMTVLNGAEVLEYDSLYVREFLEGKDKYSSFTGSNAPIVEIETDVDNGKSLLVIKDSYAHSLVPFLSKHYSKITMVDMRYINTDIGRFVDLDEYSQVLFVYNAISFAEEYPNTAKLALTK